MWLFIIIGFVIPWILGIVLYRRYPKVVLLVTPATVVVSGAFNAIGYALGWWRLVPTLAVETITTYPFNFGLYSILTICMIIGIDEYRLHAAKAITLFSLIFAGLELVGVLIGRVQYGNGWNIGWTWASYLLGLSLVYGYISLLRRHRILL